MNKNDILTGIEIIDYSHMGMGVAKVDNFTIFVEYGIIGERYDLRLTKVKKNYAFASICNWQKTETTCPYYYQCGGCNLMHLEYDKQLKLKQNTLQALAVKQKLNIQVQAIVGSEPLAYRNKIAMPIVEHKGQLKLGYYTQNSHDFFAVDKCLLASILINEQLPIISKALNASGECAYNYKHKSGNLRHVVIRSNGQKLMLIVVTKNGKIANVDQFLNTLNLEKYASIYINTQNRPTRQILGAKNKLIYGQKMLEMELYKNRFKVLPNAFFQVNIAVMETLIKTILERVEIENMRVLDAFCGTGTLGMLLASKAREVIGIEIDDEAVRAAKQNAMDLAVTNAKYICADIETEIKNYAANYFDLIIVDPPRTGLAQFMKKFIIEASIEQFIYISCDPSTLTRDLSALSSYYEVEYMQAFDMFAQTHHFETLVILRRRHS